MTRASPAQGEHRLLIRESLDVFAARWTAQQVAGRIGFLSHARQEIAIVVSELGTNILKYGLRGAITIRGVDDQQLGVGIEVVAEDEGPPLADLDTAVRDGFSDSGPIDPVVVLRRGGIGAGLGAIIRMTDRFEYNPSRPRKSFRVIRYLHRPRPTAP
jgi:anti-sigma regulatory factor (Ser/Thr protein kinase)